MEKKQLPDINKIKGILRKTVDAAADKGRKVSESNRFQSFGILSHVNVYPDYGTDLDGFDFGMIKLVIAVLGVIMMTATGLLDKQLPVWLAILMYSISLLCSGIYCFANLLECIRSGRFFCEVLPVLIGSVAAFCTGMYKSSIIALLIYEAAKLYEKAKEKKEHLLAEAVVDLLPKYATVALPGKRTERRKPSHLRAGDVVLVRESEIIPIDGVVLDGMSTIDYTPVTREQKTAPAAKGSKVLSGGINIGRPILVRASCDFNNSTAKKIYSSFASSISRTSVYGDKVIRVYNILYPVILGISLLFGVIIPIFSHNWVTGIRRGAAILVCACPAGILGLLELCVFVGVRRIFASGAVIRDGRLLDKFSRLDTFVCNKTGTLTKKDYRVIEVMPVGYSGDDPCAVNDPLADRLLDIMLRAESISVHPIAIALRKYCGVPENISVGNMEGEEIPGRGISAVIEGDTVYCGNASLLFSHGINCMVPATPGNAVHVAVNGVYMGYVVLENDAREGNFDAMEKLRSCGVRNFSLISSDLRSVVRPIAASLSFTNVKAEVSPEEKPKSVAYLAGAKTFNRTIAFLGNGSDELDSAAKADISAASDVLWNEKAWNSSDVSIFSEGIEKFPDVISAGYSSMQISRYSMAVNLAARGLALLLAMIGVMNYAVVVIFFSILAIVSNYFTGKI